MMPKFVRQILHRLKDVLLTFAVWIVANRADRRLDLVQVAGRLGREQFDARAKLGHGGQQRRVLMLFEGLVAGRPRSSPVP